MANAIQLFGALILTVVGFIVPFLTILISLFPEGVKSLSSKYENERNQSDENIANEITKKEKKKGLDYNALEKTLKTLKNKKRDAELKLRYLKPNQFLLKTSGPFILSLIAIIFALVLDEINICYIVTLLISGFIAFMAGLVALFTGISVVFEVAEIVNQKKNSNEEKIISLLSLLVEKAGDNPYIKEGQIQFKFNTKSLKKDTEIDFSVDKKYEIPISIYNRSDKMAKTVEIGVIFPKDVVIEKTSNIDITTTEETQIVRFKEEAIQSYNDTQQGNIQLTFLKLGLVNSEIFIKGENIKHQRFPFKFKIIK